MCDNKSIDFNKYYFIFPKFNLKSYMYSQFFYKFRKQILRLSIKTISNFSILAVIPFDFTPVIDFFAYSHYFLSVNFYSRDFQNYTAWSGVYNSVFFSFSTLSVFIGMCNFSNLFVFSMGVNLIWFSKIFGYFYYLLLQSYFFFDLKHYVALKLIFKTIIKNMSNFVKFFFFGKNLYFFNFLIFF